METGPRLTIAQHVAAVRKDHRLGMVHLVAALRADPGFVDECNGRLKVFREMEQAGRMDACWISRITKETLTAALAAANTQPDVPATGD